MLSPLTSLYLMYRAQLQDSVTVRAEFGNRLKL